MIWENKKLFSRAFNISFRHTALLNEQKIKLINNSASYSVNEDLIDVKTVKSMQYSPPWSSSVPIADTPVCSKIDNSIHTYHLFQ